MGRQIFEGVARVEVVNLRRRPDRLAAFKEEICSVLGREFADSIQVREAVDGLQLTPTDELEELFRDNWFGSRRPVIATCLSHALVWVDAATTDGPVLVFEDDVTLAPHFPQVLRRVLAELEERFPAWDLALLGTHLWHGLQPDDPRSEHRLAPLRWTRYMGGSFGYLVSPKGATRLLELVEAHGWRAEIDMQFIPWQDELIVLEASPATVFSPVVKEGLGDTDTQRDRSDLFLRW